MRILAFSDLHRNTNNAQLIVAAAATADIVIGAGDFATEGLGLSDTFEILKALTIPTIIIPGNHDNPSELQQNCQNHKNMYFLHGNAVTINGIIFFGLGYEIPISNDKPWNQGIKESEAATLLKACPESSVLITHTPPFGVADLQTNGQHEGSQVIRKTVESTNPRLHLCGHIHHAWGTSGFINQCPVYNLGPSLNWFTV